MTYSPAMNTRLRQAKKPDVLGSSSDSLNVINAAVATCIYHPLKTGEIRLVQLHPSTDQQDIVCCSLSTVPLDVTSKYDALSYTWGSQKHPVRIELDGHPLKVTRNLCAALRALRDPHSDRVLWVDALSINQSDISERNAQVPRMTKLYSLADRTVAFLGHEDQSLEMFCKQITPLWETQFVRGELPAPPADKSLQMQQLSRAFILFRKLPYWHRVWVVQEIMHSSSISMQYGRSTWSLSHLTDLLRWWLDSAVHPMGLDRRWPLYLMLEELDILRGYPQRRSHLEIRPWLRMCFDKECLDPRDRIFGYHGCLPPEIRQRLTVDYARPINEVYIEATLAIAASDIDLNILVFAEKLGKDTVSALKLPSWVPDFSAQTEKPPYEDYDNGVDPKPPSPHHYRHIEFGHLLHVRGRFVGTISRISHDYISNMEATEPLECLVSYIRTVLQALEVSAEGFHSFIAACVDLRSSNPFTFEQCTNLIELLYASTADNLNVSLERAGEVESMMLLRILHVRRSIFAFEDVQSRPVQSIERTGYGTGPAELQKGDEVWNILGCHASLILRPVSRHHRLIGAANIPSNDLELTEDGLKGQRMLGPTSQDLREKDLYFKKDVYLC